MEFKWSSAPPPSARSFIPTTRKGVVAVATSITSAFTAIAWFYYSHRYRRRQYNSNQAVEQDENEKILTTETKIAWEEEKKGLIKLRLEERRGRISAEIRLREALKECHRFKCRLRRHREILSHMEVKEKNEGEGNCTEDKTNESLIEDNFKENDEEDHLDRKLEKSNYQGNAHDGVADHFSMYLQCVGMLHSPFTKRVGTPRQGALVPSSVGFIQFFSSVAPMECLEGIEDFSHAWIIFQFHANTNYLFHTKKNKRTKIRPPRAPKGTKVGQLATRSPHRPNALGLSLVKVDGLDHASKRLYISALDLVHGTPVYDVKPFVPWDIPGYCSNKSNSSGSINATDNLLRVPPWVDCNDDVLPNIQYTKTAMKGLNRVLECGRLSPFYADKPSTSTRNGHARGGKNKACYVNTAGLYEAKKAIEEILSQDPRASNVRGTASITSTGQKNSGIGMLQTDDTYRLLFGQSQVEFIVEQEGTVTITDIIDASSVDDGETVEYADGIPLSSCGLMRMK